VAIELRKIYEDYGSMVYNLCLNYVQNTQDAEEITQDVFVKIHFKYSTYSGKSSLKTWIYKITVNLCLDFIKSRNRQKRFAFLLSIFDGKGNLKYEPEDFHHPGAQLELKEQTAAIFAIIHQLPARQKTALLLTKLEGLPQSEAAEVMGLSVKALESLLQRAKSNILKKAGPEWAKALKIKIV
jgi:RNA polymerase sigma factor (sigma-70 family)